MVLVLANSVYWPAVFLAMVAGAILFFATLFWPRFRGGWWWKLPVAVALIIGPYLLDVARARMTEGGESWFSAVVPTTLLLSMMGPDNQWPYGTVFDRLHKAPARHAMWDGQLDRLVLWCQTCIASGDPVMAMRGTQIAATLSGRGRTGAVVALLEAAMHKDRAVATLACDVLISLKPSIEEYRPLMELAATSSPHEDVRRRLGELVRKAA